MFVKFFKGGGGIPLAAAPTGAQTAPRNALASEYSVPASKNYFVKYACNYPLQIS